MKETDDLDNYILQVEAITEGLKELDSSNSDLFEQNKKLSPE